MKVNCNGAAGFTLPFAAMGDGTPAMGKRHKKTHGLCPRCGKRSYHIQRQLQLGCRTLLHGLRGLRPTCACCLQEEVCGMRLPSRQNSVVRVVQEVEAQTSPWNRPHEAGSSGQMPNRHTQTLPCTWKGQVAANTER